jgi:hypothetical protein
MARAPAFRNLGVVIAWTGFLLAVAPSAHAETESDRGRVIAALERLMLTGEPRHTSHDAGEWLQGVVDAAVRRGDVELERLARRAAVPLVVRISSPVASTADLPHLLIQMPPVLRVREPITYRAEVAVSLDGGAWVPVGGFVSSSSRSVRLDRVLPAAAGHPGAHHLQVRARITWDGGAFPAETRDLPEIVYTIYDPQDGSRLDARLFVDSARTVAANRLDSILPPEPLERWLLRVLAAHVTASPPEIRWRVTYCDERLVEAGTLPRSRDLCAVASILVEDGLSGVGEVWIRTGRIERREAEYHWLADAPRFEVLVMRAVEFSTLSALAPLLAQPLENWPAPDLSVVPEDLHVLRDGDLVRVTAIVRNASTVGVRGVLVSVDIETPTRQRARRSFALDVPSEGSASLETWLPIDAPYGVVAVHAVMSEHSPFPLILPDPTPEDNLAFRVVNPDRAPEGYLRGIIDQGGYPCRGY